LLLFVAVIAFTAALPASDALAKRPHIMKGCKTCHTAKPDVVRGKLVNHSGKFRSIQLDVGPLVWIIKYDDGTALKGTDSLAKARATHIAVKQPYKISAEKVVSPMDMKALMKKGPKEGGFTLVDARPPAAYASGHMPGAVSIPYPAFKKKHAKVLPKDKDMQVIFYCGGNT
jgi:hypothetical protein